MSDIRYGLTTAPAAEDLDAIGKGISEYNLETIGNNDRVQLALFARDGEGRLIGGVNASLKWEWLHVHGLWVDKAHRHQGVGSRLLEDIIAEAAARGVYRVQLETMSFQALGFYLKHGFTVFAQIEGKPTGHTLYYLKREGPSAQ